MSALFVRPLPFVAGTTSPAPVAGSVANLAIDPPLVWRGALTSYLIVDLGAGAVSYDTVGLVGCNLLATDTVRIRTGGSETSFSYDSGTVAAWTGSKPPTATSKAIFRLPALHTERYVRIDIASASTDGFAQFQRLVVGAAIQTGGIDFDAEMGFEDRSVITSGSGYSSVDIYDVLLSWKISTGFIADAVWRGSFAPMLLSVGSNSGILFVVDDSVPSNWQTDAIFARVTTKASGKAEGFNAWRFEATLTSIAA